MADTPKFGVVSAGDLVAHRLSTMNGAPGSSFSEGIVLKAAKTNTGVIYIGYNNAVTAANGFELNPTESLSLEIANDEDLWIIQSVAADKLNWATVNK